MEGEMMYRADLQAPPKSPDADRPSAWAKESEIQPGKLADDNPAAAQHSKVSRTVVRILSALDDIDWFDA
jgi:hypothetical protein